MVLGLLAVPGLRVGAQQTPPPPPPASPVIARVEGRTITQEDFDRVAKPYFDRLKSEMKSGFTEDVKKLASYNVLEELIRRELLVVQAQREKIPVFEIDTDRILRQDPFFYATGKFDQAKFIQYKLNPATNYLAVLPRIREMAAAGKLDSLVRIRLAPSPALVRAEWAKRNNQVRFKFLQLGLRDISLEPEATEAECAAYYAGHPEKFENKPRLRLRYLRLPLPSEGDSLRDSTQAAAMARGRGMADSLRAGTSIDTLGASLGGVLDTGPVEMPPPPTGIPGLGRGTELVGALAHADSDTTVRVVGPVVATDAVMVGVVAERQPKALRPMREVMADVKRQADAEKRRTTLEADKLAFYEAHRPSYRTHRVPLTRVLLSPSALAVKPAPPKEVERWYAEHGRALTSTPDTVPLPTLGDSLRELVRARLSDEARADAAARAITRVAEGWSAGKDVRPLARAAGAAVETLTVSRGAATDSIFPAALIDSLIAEADTIGPGKIRGPRTLKSRVVLWRADALDTSYVPPFEWVRASVERDFNEDKQQKNESEAKIYFEGHKTEYKTRVKYVVDYITAKIPPADSVQVPEADLRAHYDKNHDSFKQEEQVRARHILIGTRPGQTPERVAKARADSLLVALRGGADFADLAQRFSQDPGSARQGGDLGFFGRGRMVKEFSDTSFALEPGRVSQPVKTPFGYHLIKVEEKKAAGFRPFEEVRDEIRRQLAQARGDSAARQSAEAMRRRIARGQAVAVVAAAAGGVLTSAPFAANEPVPGLGPVQGLAQELDSLKVGRWAPKTYRAGASYALIRLTQRIPSTQADFSEVKAQAIRDTQNAKKKELLAKKVAAIRGQLASGASLDSVAAIHGGLKDSGLLTETSGGFVPLLGVEPRILSKAFATKPGTTTDTLTTAQGVAWIRVDEKKTLEGASFAKDKVTITQELTQKKYAEWLEEKKKTMKIEILRADLREKPKPIQQTFTVGGGQ